MSFIIESAGKRYLPTVSIDTWDAEETCTAKSIARPVATWLLRHADGMYAQAETLISPPDFASSRCYSPPLPSLLATICLLYAHGTILSTPGHQPLLWWYFCILCLYESYCAERHLPLAAPKSVRATEVQRSQHAYKFLRLLKTRLIDAHWWWWLVISVKASALLSDIYYYINITLRHFSPP